MANKGEKDERRKKLFQIAEELREWTKKQAPEEGFRVVITCGGFLLPTAHKVPRRGF